MINTRQQKYKKNRILGMNMYNAARAAGYSENTAKSHTKELEERVKIADILERQGLTDGVLILKLSELLSASKVTVNTSSNKRVEKGGKGEIESPDWSARARGLELALKLKNLLRDSPIIDQSQHTHLHFIREALVKSDMIGADGKFRHG